MKEFVIHGLISWMIKINTFTEHIINSRSSSKAKLVAMSRLGACQYLHIFYVLIRELNALYLWISVNKHKKRCEITVITNLNSILNHVVGPSCLVVSTVCRIRCILDLLNTQSYTLMLNVHNADKSIDIHLLLLPVSLLLIVSIKL